MKRTNCDEPLDIVYNKQDLKRVNSDKPLDIAYNNPDLKRVNSDKPLDIAYNNPDLSDLALHIGKKGFTDKVIIWVSKLYLASKSTFFRQMFLHWLEKKKTPEKTKIEFLLDEDVDITHFEDLIRAIYKQDLQTPPEDILSVIKLADKYEVPTAIKHCVNILLKLEMTLDNACTFLSLPEHIKKFGYVEQLITPSSKFILDRFRRVRELFRDKDFLELPVEALLVLVKSDDLIVDSENSVLYFIMTWILKEQERREIYFLQLLPHIRFSQMLKYFLLDIVPYMATLFKNPEFSKQILQYRSQAIEGLVGGFKRQIRKNRDKPTNPPDPVKPNSELDKNTNPSNPGKPNSELDKNTNPPNPGKSNSELDKNSNSPNPGKPNSKLDKNTNPPDPGKPNPDVPLPLHQVPRATLQDSLRFTIKCIFKEVNRWDLYGRYYSDPVFAHGYEFYFFLRKQRINPTQNPETNGENPADFTLAGFLRCTSRFMPTKHYLPICSTVSILLKGNSERKFTPSRIVFEASEKAIGGKLTILDENWLTIVSGESPLVIDNTMTIMVSVEFLNSDENCQLIEATTD